MDPIGEIIKAVSGGTMNGWGALAILAICGAYAYAQRLRYLHHAEERAARGPDAQMPQEPAIKPPGAAGLLLLLIGLCCLAVVGARMRERPAGGVAGAAPPGCSPVTCKPPARCTADGCADIASPHGELAGDPPWASARNVWDGRTPWLGGGS